MSNYTYEQLQDLLAIKQAEIERLLALLQRLKCLSARALLDLPDSITPRQRDLMLAIGPGGEASEVDLSGLKAKWQAEILGEFTHGNLIMPAALNLAMCERRKELERIAAGDDHDR